MANSSTLDRLHEDWAIAAAVTAAAPGFDGPKFFRIDAMPVRSHHRTRLDRFVSERATLTAAIAETSAIRRS
jgi:hypothetical protein